MLRLFPVLLHAVDWRARAAYAAYNGGPGKICRWTKKKNTWARNDRGYWEKYQSQGWLKFVASADARSSVDVECLVEGGDRCGAGVATEPAPVVETTASLAAPESRAEPFLRSFRSRGKEKELA